jgi:hypothetical protein
MNKRKCSFLGCKNKHRAKGLCSTHWNQQRRGQPLFSVLGSQKEKKMKAKKKLTTTRAKVLRALELDPQIVGLRAASLTLGISKALIYRVIQKSKKSGNRDLLPVMAQVFDANQRKTSAFVWQDEAALAEWWEKVRAEDPGTLPAMLNGVENGVLPPEPTAPPVKKGKGSRTMTADSDYARGYVPTAKTLKKLKKVKAKLGIIPDLQLAKIAKVSYETIRRYRMSLGIKGVLATRAKAETETLVSGKTDNEVMIEALLDSGTIEALRVIRVEHGFSDLKEVLVLTVALGLSNWDL